VHTNPSKRWNNINKSKKKHELKLPDEAIQNEETYHFIGYVPAYGKVWELDGLKTGPLEVGELPCGSSSQFVGAPQTSRWMDIVRPALKMKMKKYGGTSGGNEIRFSLLALIHDQYQVASDEFELVKRERRALERRLDGVHPGGWKSKVHQLSTKTTRSHSPKSYKGRSQHPSFRHRSIRNSATSDG
jgi:ubiquitin carboxyl-terminal hydrolase L5